MAEQFKVFRVAARRVVEEGIQIGATLVLATFLGSALIWLAPGLGLDESALDARLSAGSRQLAAARASHGTLPGFYAQFVTRLCRGDLGTSVSLGRPVKELLAERFPVTLRSAAAGLAAAWILGTGLAALTLMTRSRLLDLLAGFAAAMGVSLPSALVAFLFLLLGLPPAAAVAAVLAPRIFRYARELIASRMNLPHVLMAEASGLSRTRIMGRYVLPCVAPELAALFGVYLSAAFGACVTIEVICDSPGIGQLAWTAALGRDVEVLVVLTLILAALTLIATRLSDLVISGLRAEAR